MHGMYMHTILVFIGDDKDVRVDIPVALAWLVQLTHMPVTRQRQMLAHSQLSFLRKDLLKGNRPPYIIEDNGPPYRGHGPPYREQQTSL